MSSGQAKVDAVIIGAGQAGVALSYCLTRHGVGHVVVEKERPLAEWFLRRWDSFRMNTPNWMNTLPGETEPFAPGRGRHALGSLADARHYFGRYLADVDPPVEIDEATGVRRDEDGDWCVVTRERRLPARAVAICTGHAGEKKVPPFASSLPPHVDQIHSSDYRNPRQLDSSEALVVGSGASGVQICHDLARSGHFRRLWLAVSGNVTLPWTVAGIPTHTLLRRLGVFSIHRGSWLGERLYAKLICKGDMATPPSPGALRRRHGVCLVPKVRGYVDGAIEAIDGQRVPCDDLTVVWCTGFRTPYDFIEVPESALAFDRFGQPIHRRGVVESAPGLYFLGLRFLYTLVSQDLYGIGQDARYLASKIAERVARQPA